MWEAIQTLIIGPALILLLDRLLLGEALKAQRLGRAGQTKEGKCMYIKKWILAQTEAPTDPQVSMFVPDKGHYFSTEIKRKTQPYERFEGCWLLWQVETRT